MNIQGVVGTLIAGTIGIYGISMTVEKFNLDKIKSINEDFNIVLNQVEELKQNEGKLVNKYNELYNDANLKIEDANLKVSDLSSSIEQKDKYISELEKKIKDLNVYLQIEKESEKKETATSDGIDKKDDINDVNRETDNQKEEYEQNTSQPQDISQDDVALSDINKSETNNGSTEENDKKEVSENE